MARILLVEDDIALARGLLALLSPAGYAIDHVQEGADVVALAAEDAYGLIVLDIGLPDLSGLDVLRQLRRAGNDTPVLLLTARDALKDRVTGLDLGADDYMVKPFEPSELEARIRVLLRRKQGAHSAEITVGTLVCDLSLGTASVSGVPLDLRRREWTTLVALASRAGKVVSKERLALEIFSHDEPVAPNAVELYVARVRKRLPLDGPKIRTLRGLGYILEPR